MAGPWNNFLKFMVLMVIFISDGIIGFPFSSSTSHQSPIRSIQDRFSATQKAGAPYHLHRPLPPRPSRHLSPSTSSSSSSSAGLDFFHLPTRAKSGLLSYGPGFLDLLKPEHLTSDYRFGRMSAGLRRTRIAAAVAGRFEQLSKLSKGFGEGRVARHLYEVKKRGQGFFGLDNHNFVMETLTQSRGNSREEEDEEEEDEEEAEDGGGPRLTSDTEASRSSFPLSTANDAVEVSWLNPESFSGRRRQRLRVRPSIQPTPALSINADLAKLRELMEKAGR